MFVHFNNELMCCTEIVFDGVDPSRNDDDDVRAEGGCCNFIIRKKTVEKVCELCSIRLLAALRRWLVCWTNYGRNVAALLLSYLIPSQIIH